MRPLSLPRAEQTLHGAGCVLATHRHHEGYLALVLEGAYEELSPDGRFRLGPGQLVIHPPFHVHGNRFGPAGARVLNLPWRPEEFAASGYKAGRIEKLDPIIRCAHRDAVEAAQRAAEMMVEEQEPPRPADLPRWVARLADSLREDVAAGERETVRKRARETDISPEHAARAFRRYFGVTPGAYRREHRARRALGLLAAGHAPAEVAAECAYSDQSHLSREIRRMTGRTPSAFTA